MVKRLLLFAMIIALAAPWGCTTAKAKLEQRYAEGLLPFDTSGLESAGLTTVWQQELADMAAGKKSKIRVTGVYLYDETVLVTTADDAIYCFQRADGKILWVSATPGKIQFAPTLFDSKYYAVIGRQLAVIDGKGNLEMGATFPTSISKPLVVTDDCIYAAGSDGSLHKLDNEKLLDIWLAPQRTEAVIMGKPIAVGALLVFGTSDGRLIGADRLTGGRRLDEAGLGPVSGEIVSDGDSERPLLYFGSGDYRAYCYSTLGSRIWDTIVDGQVSRPPVLVGDVLYVDVMGVGLTALNKDDGAKMWLTPGSEGFVATDARRVFVTSYNQELWVVDASDGKVTERLNADEYTFAPRNLSGDGLVLLATVGGKITCLKAK